MQTHSWMRRAGWLAGVAMIFAAVAALRADGPPEVSRLYDYDADGDVDIFIIQPEPIKLSDHWIGVGCSPVGDALRAQLSLPEGEGLVVERVEPESPAGKTGLQQYDVLLKADGKPLKKTQDLVDAVDGAKDKELRIELVRGGKSKTLKIKPVKRPEEGDVGEAEARPAIPPFQPPHEAFRKWWEEIQPPGGRRQPGGLRFWGPGTILPPGAKIHPPMPGNMSVTITKRGDEPAKIVVKQDDKKWEVTENDLDKLPPDVRPHVERMLGRLTLDRPGKHFQDYKFDVVPDLREWPRWGPFPEGRVEKQIEEMRRQLDQLRKSIEEMHQKRPRLKAPPPKLDAPEPKQQQEQV